MNALAAVETTTSVGRSFGDQHAQSTGMVRVGRISRMALNLAFGLAALSLAASPLYAGEISAMNGESIDVGGFHGVVYYTPETDGHRVVATIADGEAGSPLRFSATLNENQSATLSVAGKAGEPARTLKFSRSGDKIIVVEEEATSATQKITQ